MTDKELGKNYLVVFCKGCGAGYRIRAEPIPPGYDAKLVDPERHTCPGCGHTDDYTAADARVARFQKDGLGRHKQRQ
ncbi:MAG: hypothetical protein AB7Q23_17355 [Hyphomonadaceae bacterium]